VTTCNRSLIDNTAVNSLRHVNVNWARVAREVLKFYSNTYYKAWFIA